METKERGHIRKGGLDPRKPLVIKGYGVFFTVEDRNQKFGPFDYQTYLLFINVLKAYGYAIAIISLLIYIALTLNGSGRKDKIMKY